jgi:hypothetical protein
MGYPDAGSRDLARVVPGSLFEQLVRPGAWRRAPDAYVVRWATGSVGRRRGAASGWREIYRSQGNPPFVIYAPEGQPGRGE